MRKLAADGCVIAVDQRPAEDGHVSTLNVRRQETHIPLRRLPALWARRVTLQRPAKTGNRRIVVAAPTAISRQMEIKTGKPLSATWGRNMPIAPEPFFFEAIFVAESRYPIAQEAAPGRSPLSLMDA
jgi:hypothetical protein